MMWKLGNGFVELGKPERRARNGGTANGPRKAAKLEVWERQIVPPVSEGDPGLLALSHRCGGIGIDKPRRRGNLHFAEPLTNTDKPF
jgi:hypothetical protein